MDTDATLAQWEGDPPGPDAEFESRATIGEASEEVDDGVDLVGSEDLG